MKKKNNKRVTFFSSLAFAENPAFDAISTKAENILRIIDASIHRPTHGCWGMRKGQHMKT